MRRTRLAFGVILLAVLLSGCGTTADTGEILYQYGTLNALMAGVYDGDLTIGELSSHGDQGLGTINALDGEMLIIDGETYQVAYDGSVRVLSDEQLTPFAVVTQFDTDVTFTMTGLATFDELKAAIDRSRPSANLPYAIRVDGTFASVKTRSVPAQTEPYRPLLEVLKGQSEFEFTNVQGTIVGFWLPAYMSGPNAGGYHLHFLTAALDGGGHVLDCVPMYITIGLDQTGQWTAELPTEGAFLSTELSGEQYK
jgi:acetolactate decarboxylase